MAENNKKKNKRIYALSFSRYLRYNTEVLKHSGRDAMTVEQMPTT